jgi:hypothetical protein
MANRLTTKTVALPASGEREKKGPLPARGEGEKNSPLPASGGGDASFERDGTAG